jgi:CheY-like chemotaxis protein
MGIGADGSSADLACMDLARSTREALSVITPAMGQVEITVKGPLEGCWVSGKPRQIEQVLINLLSNALQALPTASAGKINLTVLEKANGWVVQVEDNGPGIPAASRAAIFEPFYTTKPAGQGTGLGLSISLGIVRAMGGTLDVDESPLGGARLTLWLPVAAAPGDGLMCVEANDGTEKATSHGHVLIVDDEDLARQEMAAALADLGYHVSTAPGGDAARALLAQAAETPQPVDLVITDLRMADGDGYSLLAHLEEDYPQLFTIVVTGQPLRDREALAERGVNADEVCRTPVGLGLLSEVLAGLLAGG